MKGYHGLVAEIHILEECHKTSRVKIPGRETERVAADRQILTQISSLEIQGPRGVQQS